MTDSNSTPIGRDVKITGGDFVGRDKITNIYPPGLASAELTPEQLAAAESRYRAQVSERYNRLGFAGLGIGDTRLSDVALEDVFVRLTLTVEKTVREPVPPEEWAQEREREERSRNPFRRGAKKEDERPRERTVITQEPITLGHALTQHALIVGEPGAGKSTLLRWLAVTFAAGRQQEADRLGPQADADRLPLLVELGRLPEQYLKAESRETPNWKVFLPEDLTKQPPFDAIPAPFLEQALAAGRCLLLCDGLDEIADLTARRRLADSLADYARSSQNRLVLSSRPAGVSGSEGALGACFQRLTIQRFTPEDVRRFFGFLYALDSELTRSEQAKEAEALFRAVEGAPKTLELATTPLLATLLFSLWNENGYLPERRVELYELCCQMLIESWEAHHDVAYTGVLADIGWERHLRLLAPLAYAIHNGGQRTDAPARELIPVLARAMQEEGLAAPPSATLEAEKFLRTLSLRSGLLQFLGGDRYGFPHLTFQEYLTARHIAAQPDPDYIDLVMVDLHKAWWREVHLLVIGHLGSGKEGAEKASKLLLQIFSLYLPPWPLLRSVNINLWIPDWLKYCLDRHRKHSFLQWPVLVLAYTFVLPSLLSAFVKNSIAVRTGWQLERRLAWVLEREFIFIVVSFLDCKALDMKGDLSRWLAKYAWNLLFHIILDPGRAEEDYNSPANLAARTQGQLGQASPEVIRLLISALEYPNWFVQQAASKSLVQLGESSPDVARALVDVLGNSDGFMRWNAAEALVELGQVSQDAVKGLVSALGDSNFYVRLTVAEKLGKSLWVSEDVMLALISSLNDTEVSVQRAAASSLGKPHSQIDSVVKALISALDASNSSVRAASAESLGKIAKVSPEVVNALIGALGDSSPDVRAISARSLEFLGNASPVVVSELAGALRDIDFNVQYYAGGSLAEIGKSSSAAIQALLDALDDSNPSTRAIAARSLGKLGKSSPEVVNALLTALGDADPYVRYDARGSLVELGISSPDVRSSLLNALPDDCIDFGSIINYRLWVAQTKPDIGNRVEDGSIPLTHSSPETIRILVNALDNPDYNERDAAAKRLGQLSVKIEDEASLRQALIALNRLLHSRNDDVRRAALIAIRRLLDGRQIPGYRWVPIREQQRRRRRRQVLDIGVLGIGLVVLAALAVGIGFGRLELSAGWVQVAGGLALLAVLAGGWDLFWSYRRRPSWDR